MWDFFIKLKTMRTIKLIPTDYVHFIVVAREYQLWFLSNFLGGIYVVEANSELLENLGY